MRHTVFTTLALVSTTYGFNVNTPLSLRNNVADTSATQMSIKKPVLGNKSNALITSSSSLKASTSTSSGDNVELDTDAIVKYTTAFVTQLSLITGFFFGLDSILAATDMNVLPTPVTFIMFYAFSLKSRTFNPLNNDRPNRKKAIEGEGSDGFQDRIQPNWTPPGVVFPIMWLLIIGPLRAASSTMIVESVGSYLSVPVMSLMLHLTCGDIWNTINNTEKRFGTSVLAISTVYVSALHAAYRYYEVDPTAGKLLGATAIWLTIASALITQTWRLNVDADGNKQSLLPIKNVGEDSVTGFAWGKKQEE